MTTAFCVACAHPDMGWDHEDFCPARKEPELPIEADHLATLLVFPHPDGVVVVWKGEQIKRSMTPLELIAFGARFIEAGISEQRRLDRGDTK